MDRTKIPAETRAAFRAKYADPVAFNRHLMRANLWARQEEILRAIEEHPRVAVKACHASGKTFLAAGAVMWGLVAKRGIVITTAPTWLQVKKLLWGEIHTAIGRSRLRFPKPSMTELTIGPKNYAIGLSTNEGVKFQGFHEGFILVVIDEAPGVRPDIWEAIEGARAGGDVRVLALGNPTIPGGPFYDAFGKHRAGWSTHTISAFDTPNFADGIDLDRLLAMSPEELRQNAMPYLTTRSWVREKYHEWVERGGGDKNPLWMGRVLGQFPEQSDAALIAIAWLEQAALRERRETTLDVVAGIDVAGPGEDETVFFARSGANILEEQGWYMAEPRGQLVKALRAYGDRLVSVNVDSAGIGYYLALHLQDLGFPVRFVNVGTETSDPEKYKNLKAELYWALRMRYQDGDVCGAVSDKAFSQLASIQYEHNARGQIEIESKEDARKRGVVSPDRAEALMLAFAPPASSTVTVTTEPVDEETAEWRRRPVRMGRM